MPEPVSMHRRLLALCAFASLGGVAVGLVLQHQFGMEPCAWCVVQRMFYVLVGGFSLAARHGQAVAQHFHVRLEGGHAGADLACQAVQGIQVGSVDGAYY